MHQHMKFDHTIFNGIFKTELNIYLRKIRSRSKSKNVDAVA